MSGAGGTSDAATIQLAEMGSFHVGGRTVAVSGKLTNGNDFSSSESFSISKSIDPKLIGLTLAQHPLCKPPLLTRCNQSFQV